MLLQRSAAAPMKDEVLLPQSAPATKCCCDLAVKMAKQVLPWPFYLASFMQCAHKETQTFIKETATAEWIVA